MLHYHSLKEFRSSLEYRGRIVAWNNNATVFVLTKDKGIKLGCFLSHADAKGYIDRTANIYRS